MRLLSAPQWVFVVSLLLLILLDFCMEGDVDASFLVLSRAFVPLAVAMGINVGLRFLFWVLKVDAEIGKRVHLSIWWFCLVLLYIGWGYLAIILAYPIIAFLLCSLYYLCSAIYLSVRLLSLRRQKLNDDY